MKVSYSLTFSLSGCSEDLFLNTIQLQQQRIGIEKALEEEKKVAADLKKEYNALAKKVL